MNKSNGTKLKDLKYQVAGIENSGPGRQIFLPIISMLFAFVLLCVVVAYKEYIDSPYVNAMVAAIVTMLAVGWTFRRLINHVVK